MREMGWMSSGICFAWCRMFSSISSYVDYKCFLIVLGVLGLGLV